MFRILKLNRIDPAVDDILVRRYAVGDAVADPHGILVRSAPMLDYLINPSLLAVARAGAGVNNIPIDRMTERGVAVFNTPGANANAVRELVVLALLLASRDALGATRWADTLTGDVARAAESGKSKFVGRELRGKTLGVVGLGAVGAKVAEAAYGLGMIVLGYDPYVTSAAGVPIDGAVLIRDLNRVYEKSDFVTLHVPLCASTSRMIDADAISRMKDGATLINAARAGLVDVAAVKAALKTGKLSKYVVDFPDSDTINSEGIICFPHLGASTVEAERNCAVMAANELSDYLENGNVSNSVNFPALTKRRSGAKRTCALFRAEDADLVDGLGPDRAIKLRDGLGYALIDGDEHVEFDRSLKIRYI